MTVRSSVPTFCGLCIAKCGAIATVEDGELIALEADPTHPTGDALCLKGKAAPELVGRADRLLHPMKRTRPKGDPDPGWQRIGWDEALATAAARLEEVAGRHGPEAVVFSSASPSTTAMADSLDWLQRLRRAFGSPNLCGSVELCGWGRYFASVYTYGASVPGAYLPDLEQAGCILFWGYNPSIARLPHATRTTAALERGAKLIVVDPRRVGLAKRADHWLRVRPGTDGALALSLAHVMIERGWFDREFVARYTNAPFLVGDDGRFHREGDRYVAWDAGRKQAVHWDPSTGTWDVPEPEVALDGDAAFQRMTELCRRFEPHVAERITGVPAAAIEGAARTLYQSRPVAYYAWSGVEQHSASTQTARAIGVLYALTGSLDAPGGNVLFPAVPANLVGGEELLSPAQRQKALGLAERPLGPARWEFVTSDELYTAALESKPYPVRALVGFGANLLLAHADAARGREALASLDFYLHADVFMNPTAELADVVVPVATPFETEALRLGFEVSEAAQSLVQLRRPLVAPRGEARSDLQIMFALAKALGLGEHFFDGDIDAAFRHQLAPSGLDLERLRAEPGGVRVPLTTRHRKFIEGGFGTPSRRIELYSETLLAAGQAALPEFQEPPMSPRSRPDLAERYPLVLTSAKSTWYCESQHRGLPSLRRRAPDPEVELHPETARARRIAAGDWVLIETPHGSVRARARLNGDLDPDVVCGQHGWWQACPEIGAPGYPLIGEGSANLNAILRHRPGDPVSGSAPLRAYLCNVVRL